MSENSDFTLLPNPRIEALDKLLEPGITSLLTVGIVNPFGPTLGVVAVQGKFDAGKSLNIVRLTLNPFSQQAEIIGSASLGTTWNPVRDLAPFFDVGFHSCPSLLVPSSILEEDQSVRMHAKFVLQFPDASSLFEQVTNFPGDPWNRVKQDMQGLGKPPPGATEKRKSLSESEALEFARVLLSEKHLTPELQAFLFAWKGSIEFLGRDGRANLVQEPMAVEAFSQIFAAVAISCRLPELTP